ATTPPISPHVAALSPAAARSGNPAQQTTASAAAPIAPSPLTLPLLVDPAAGRNVLLVVFEQCVREVEHPDDPPVRDPVVDRPMLPPRLDKAAPAQTGEMVRHLRLWLAETLDELANGQLTLVAQQLEDAQPPRGAKAREVLRDESAPRRCFREMERCCQLSHSDPPVKFTD